MHGTSASATSAQAPLLPPLQKHKGIDSHTRRNTVGRPKHAWKMCCVRITEKKQEVVRTVRSPIAGSLGSNDAAATSAILQYQKFNGEAKKTKASSSVAHSVAPPHVLLPSLRQYLY